MITVFQAAVASEVFGNIILDIFLNFVLYTQALGAPVGTTVYSQNLTVEVHPVNRHVFLLLIIGGCSLLMAMGCPLKTGGIPSGSGGSSSLSSGMGGGGMSSSSSSGSMSSSSNSSSSSSGASSSSSSSSTASSSSSSSSSGGCSTSINLLTDVNNCGACGHACTNSHATCNQGVCAGPCGDLPTAGLHACVAYSMAVGSAEYVGLAGSLNNSTWNDPLAGCVNPVAGESFVQCALNGTSGTVAVFRPGQHVSPTTGTFGGSWDCDTSTCNSSVYIYKDGTEVAKYEGGTSSDTAVITAVKDPNPPGLYDFQVTSPP